MEHGACNVIYLDRRARDERIRRDNLTESVAATLKSHAPGYFSLGAEKSADVYTNIEAVLSVFSEVNVFRSGASCIAKLPTIVGTNDGHIPTLLLIDIPYDEEQHTKRLSREPRTPSPTSTRRGGPELAEPDDLYGMHFLLHISSEIQQKNLSKLVIPVVILSGLDRDWASSDLPSPSVHGSQVLTDTVRMVRYLDAGAVDVLISPLSKDKMHGLAVHAYRVYREVTREESNFLASKRKRKVSWVGVDETKPYAYLREAMVSGLMNGICNPGTYGETIDASDIEVEPERKDAVAEAIGQWAFSAHDFTNDELLYGAMLMLQHALKMPELEKWRLSQDKLIVFLLSSRTAYNEFVLYHNFRHVADVLHALFQFLVRIGSLPPYPSRTAPVDVVDQPAIATLIRPFDALTLLIAAIGHDVGHPGVNNAFLVALNSPLAQLYNDRSVLESFHCAAYSQILRRYWPQAFSDMAMRKLMINSILATDMGLHFKYMSDLGNLQEKLAHNRRTLDGWKVKQLDEYRDLLCGLLIKCADISNVAREFSTAAKWANILTDEFSSQGAMEKELEIPTCLFGGPPVRDDLIKLGESQVNFMNIFARPLFEAVADILPAMQFGVSEIVRNKTIWERKIDAEKETQVKGQENKLLNAVVHKYDPMPSPFSHSTTDLTAPHATRDESVSGSSQPFRTPPSMRGSADSSRFHLPDSPAKTDAPAVNKPVSPGGLSATEQESRRLPGAEGSAVRTSSPEGQTSSRRGSADASLTTILVTGKKSRGSSKERRKEIGCGPSLRSLSPSKRSRPKSKSPSKSDKAASNGHDLSPERPTTAPSSSRTHAAVNGVDMSDYPFRQQSEIDLTHAVNGTLDGPAAYHQAPQRWDDSKRSDESNVSEWKRKMSDGGNRWKPSGWRRDSLRQPSNLEDRAPPAYPHGGAVQPGNSPSSIDRSRRDKFGLSKIWRKLKTTADKEKDDETEAVPAARDGG